MPRLLRIAALFLALLSPVAPAAADDNPLLGKWIYRSPRGGGGMLTEFTPTSMSYMPVDVDGRPLAPPRVAPVKGYRHLTQSYAIDFEPSGGFMAVFVDADTIKIIVPGMPTQGTYTRMVQ